MPVVSQFQLVAIHYCGLQVQPAPGVTPTGFCQFWSNIPTASAMGYVVPSLRDFRQHLACLIFLS
jgi:hypothetical protein